MSRNSIPYWIGTFRARMPGKTRMFARFSPDFFMGFLVSFLNSGRSGTFSGVSEGMWTVHISQNFPTPYIRTGLTKITGKFRIGDKIL